MTTYVDSCQDNDGSVQQFALQQQQLIKWSKSPYFTTISLQFHYISLQLILKFQNRPEIENVRPPSVPVKFLLDLISFSFNPRVGSKTADCIFARCDTYLLLYWYIKRPHGISIVCLDEHSYHVICIVQWNDGKSPTLQQEVMQGNPY